MALGGQQIISKKYLVFMWLFMALACGIYEVATWFMSSSIPDISEPPAIFLPAFIILSVVSAVVGFSLGWKGTQPKNGERSSAYLERATRMLIISFACLEAIAVYGMTLFFLGYSDVYRWFFISGFILILIAGIRIGPVYSNYDNLKQFESVEISIHQ